MITMTIRPFYELGAVIRGAQGVLTLETEPGITATLERHFVGPKGDQGDKGEDGDGVTQYSTTDW